MKKSSYPRFPLVFLLLLSAALPVWSQDAQEPVEVEPAPLYGLGDRILSINGGLLVPLFFQSFDGEVESTNLSLGGVGSLYLGTYLNGNMTIGGELGGMFTLSPNARVLVMVPLTAKFSYIIRRYPFEFPLSVGAGLAVTKLGDDLHIDPIIKPGASFLWNYNTEWAFGVNLAYWWVPQFYLGSSPPSDHSRIGNFLEVTLSALYHF